MTSNNRNLVFISHANPEENEFTRWIGLQLARHGYQVWSDITKLIGGEPFWNRIEEAIRNYTVKFIFVLSKTSNIKQGPLDELQVAKTVAKTNNMIDFIIPLRLDDLAFSDINIHIHGLNAINFAGSWSDGLSKLLKKLNEDNTPCDHEKYNPALISSWWKNHLEGKEVIINQEVQYLSNWFKIESLPSTLYIHSVNGKIKEDSPEGFPRFRNRNNLLSFASAKDLELEDAQSQVIKTEDILRQQVYGDDLTARYAVINMLRQTFNNYLSDIGLPFYMLSDDKKCFYFTDELLQGKKRLSFDFPGLISGMRGLTGTFRKKTWHYGISGDIRLHPETVFVIKSHVLFSEDGKNILDSKSRLHSARRSACKNWWNHHWRDRLMAAMYWIKEKIGEETLSMPVSGTEDVNVSSRPFLFYSQTDYDDSKVGVNPFLDEYSFDDEIDLMGTKREENSGE